MVENIEICFRPWGTYQTLYQSKDTNVKKIIIFPGHAISLQSHLHRDEHWTVYEGVGKATVDEKQFELNPGDYIRICRRQIHRMACIGDSPLCFIEVQTGDYFGEDDIERYEDLYGRK